MVSSLEKIKKKYSEDSQDKYRRFIEDSKWKLASDEKFTIAFSPGKYLFIENPGELEFYTGSVCKCLLLSKYDDNICFRFMVERSTHSIDTKERMIFLFNEYVTGMLVDSRHDELWYFGIIFQKDDLYHLYIIKPINKDDYDSFTKYLMSKISIDLNKGGDVIDI